MKRILIFIIALPLIANATGSDWLTQSLDRRGPRCALTNPAILTEHTPTPMGFEIAGGGVTASNNSFSVHFWNSRIATNRYWSMSDTRAILARIPSSGFSLQADVGVPVLGVRYRDFAFNAEAIVAVHANVPKGVAQIALVGCKLGKHYSLDDLVGQSLAMSDASVSYGRIIPQDYLPELSSGLTVHYYQGFVYTDTRNSTAGFVVTDELIEGSGHFQNILATNGRGFGADVGLAATLSEDKRWHADFSVQRIGAALNWDVKETQTAHFRTSVAGVNMDSVDSETYGDSAFVSDDTTTKGGSARLQLPIRLHASAQFRALPNWNITGIVNTETSDSPLGRKGVEAGVASEYVVRHWFAIEGGMLFGGRHLSLFSGGAGLRFRHYEADLNFSATGGLFVWAHGIGLSLSQRFFL